MKNHIEKYAIYTYGKSHRCIQLAENFLLELKLLEKKKITRKTENNENHKKKNDEEKILAIIEKIKMIKLFILFTFQFFLFNFPYKVTISVL